MENLFEKLPEIISAGAQSWLGIISLVICFLSIVAILFFKSERPKVKLIGFGILSFFLVTFLVVGSTQAPQDSVRDSPKIDSVNKETSPGGIQINNSEIGNVINNPEGDININQGQVQSTQQNDTVPVDMD